MLAVDDEQVEFPLEVAEKSASPIGWRGVHANVAFPSLACDVTSHGDSHVDPCCGHDDTTQLVHRHVDDHPRISVHVEVAPAAPAVDNCAAQVPLGHVADTHTASAPSA